ncbi:MAG: hypothetical protein JNK49_07810 [Planctomycetes bacterium]|nr:hypothetical protein [Planctomycetota bacterium]
MPFGAGISGARGNFDEPFLKRGHGCPVATPAEPRMGWRGVPRRGQSFDLTLRQAEPNQFALFWFGLSTTQWSSVGALPFDLTAYGAPGCSILVAPDAVSLLPTDANGQATFTLTVPTSPSLAGIEFFAQTASASSAVPLGLATSESLVIMVR